MAMKAPIMHKTQGRVYGETRSRERHGILGGDKGEIKSHGETTRYKGTLTLWGVDLGFSFVLKVLASVLG